MKRKPLIHVFIYERGELLELFKRQLLERAAPADAIRHGLTCYIIRVSERHTLDHEVIREVCGIDIALLGRLVHILPANFHHIHHLDECLDAKLDCLHRVE